jgi:hypothetical protein
MGGNVKGRRLAAEAQVRLVPPFSWWTGICRVGVCFPRLTQSAYVGRPVRNTGKEVMQMICEPRSLGLLRPCLPAVLILCGLPGLAPAQGLTFINECRAPVVVQAVSIGPGGLVRRDRPYLLRPGDMTPAILLPGDKVITVYDARVPNRILYQEAVAGHVQARFGLTDRLPGRVRAEIRHPPPPPPPPPLPPPRRRP